MPGAFPGARVSTVNKMDTHTKPVLMELDIQVRDTHKINRREITVSPEGSVCCGERSHQERRKDAVFYHLTKKGTVEQRLEGGKGRGHVEMQEGADGRGSSQHRSPGRQEGSASTWKINGRLRQSYPAGSSVRAN